MFTADVFTADTSTVCRCYLALAVAKTPGIYWRALVGATIYTSYDHSHRPYGVYSARLRTTKLTKLSRARCRVSDVQQYMLMMFIAGPFSYCCHWSQQPSATDVGVTDGKDYRVPAAMTRPAAKLYFAVLLLLQNSDGGMRLFRGGICAPLFSWTVGPGSASAQFTGDSAFNPEDGKCGDQGPWTEVRH